MLIKNLVDTYNANILPWLQNQLGEGGLPQLIVHEGQGFDVSGTPHTDFHPPRPHERPLRRFSVQISDGHGISATFMHAVVDGELKPATIIWNGQGLSALEHAVNACINNLNPVVA